MVATRWCSTVPGGDDGVVEVLPATDEAITQAARVLRAGGLVAFPTETVYGLGAVATSEPAVRRLFAAKGRPAAHPVIVHLPGVDSLRDWAADVPEPARVLAEACWPGPLTLVLRRTPGVLDAVTGGRDTVGVRVPGQPVARRLLAAVGTGLAAPSANRFGRVSPTTAAHVVRDLGDSIDLVLDGGRCRVGVESTIVDVSATRPVVLRVGGVPVERLRAILGTEVDAATAGPARAPGMLPAHYAPAARVVAVEAAAAAGEVRARVDGGQRVAFLGPAVVAGTLPDGVVELEPVEDGASYARWLYQRLRDADEAGVDVVVAVLPSPEGLGSAVRDRLRRAEAARADG